MYMNKTKSLINFRNKNMQTVTKEMFNLINLRNIFGLMEGPVAKILV